jgi:hypothetical protein
VAGRLVARARGEGIALAADGGLLPASVAQILQTGEVKILRDRNATIEPVTVPTHARRLDGFTARVISPYTKA